jgi:hypothetical protein
MMREMVSETTSTGSASTPPADSARLTLDSSTTMKPSTAWKGCGVGGALRRTLSLRAHDASVHRV